MAIRGVEMRTFSDFMSDRSGNVAMIFCCAAVPLLALAGGATDYFGAVRSERAIQSALDAAVLAGVSGAQNTDAQIAVANAYFQANRAANVTVSSVSFQPNGETLVGTATSSIPTAFLRLISIPTLQVSAHSSGSRQSYREPVCVMAMHPTRKHTLDLSGTVDVVGSSCNFYGNSTNPDDVVDPHNPENHLTGKSVQANGYGHHYIENVTPPLEHAPEVLSDPLASMAIPTQGSCLFTAKKVDGATETLSPGTYCNGLQIINGATVTLNPGTYFINQNKFLVKGSTVTGTGVTIVFVDNKSVIDWQSSTVRLTAPSTGSNKGMVMMGQRVAVSNSMVNTTVDLEGVVYLPQGDFTWTNTGTPTITAKWTAWIVDGFAWDGDGVINIPFDYEHGVPYPDALKSVVPRPGVPRLLS